ncbi:YidC/Oxa1 family membrane protein insertase [Tannockella kyphosi]|uniref:YidC/Oxa1 family membrane protein insertase n=1 Tax=Tannockella kyphosi TaxID=2899121 RepID=UPI00201234A1|nr:YidC/Oxa1 family membrane protein insertase [Tannockella kyphosi]
MVLDYKTKRVLKVLSLLFVMVVLTGCTSNLDSDGQLIASRAITESTVWSWDAGWFDFLLVIPICKAVLFTGELFGNYALGVICATIIINIITLPIMIKSTVSSQKMQMIQPEIDKIQRKYKGRKDQASQMRLSNELTSLYKKNDVSMLASLTTFLTLPIMIAMWQSVQRLEILYTTEFLGFNLGADPLDFIMQFDIKYIILIAIVAVSQFFSMEMTSIMAKRNPHYKKSSAMDQMKTMNRMMVLMIVWFAVTFPTAMSFYWITTSLITMGRTVYIQIYHIEKIKKKVHDTNTNYLNK